MLKTGINYIVDRFVPLEKHEKRFEGRDSDYLERLIVPPKIVGKKIRYMKDNTSPGMDGILPKVLLEIVEQISNSVQFVIRRGNSSVSMERSKHHTII